MTLFTQVLKVQRDRLPNEPFYLGAGLAHGNAPRQARNVGPVAGWPLLDHDQGLYGLPLTSLGRLA